MKKKVLALLWAFNNPAWALILSQELYGGLDGLASNIDDGSDLPYDAQALIKYFKDHGFTADDFVSIWDAVVDAKDKAENSKAQADDPFDWADEDEDEEDDKPWRGEKKTLAERLQWQWGRLINRLPKDIKDFIHPDHEAQMELVPWHEQIWDEAEEADKRALITELKLMIDNDHISWAIRSLHDLSYVFKPNYDLSKDDTRTLLEETQIIDPGYPNLWEDLRGLNIHYPTFYTIAEDWAWE